MSMTEREFEQQLDWVRTKVKNPAYGLFGPSSVTRRICRDSIVFLCAGRAALLQLAHPYVAHAVNQHSTTRTDAIGRFNRTFFHVYSIIFDDLDSAFATARRVRFIHSRIHGAIDEDIGPFRKGHRYSAGDVGALLWVCATLIESTVIAHEIGIGPLSAAEKDAYYEDIKHFVRLFGVPDASFPPSFPAFESYCARMLNSDEIAVGRPAREIGRFLLSSPNRWVKPLMGSYRAITAGLLPPRIREEYGLPFGRVDRLLYESSVRALRRTWSKLPARLRYVPAYVEALHRLEGRPRPDRIGRAFEQMILHAVRPA